MVVSKSPSQLERIGYDRGVCLRGTPIWIDAEQRRELCIVTTLLRRMPAPHRRIVASPRLAELMSKGGVKSQVLPSPAGRWIGLGGQKVMLHELGPRLGATGATVMMGSDRLFAAGLLGHYEAAVVEADELIVQAPALDHRGADLEQAFVALGQFLASARDDGARAAVLVDCVELAIEVYERLAEEGMRPRPMGLLQKLVNQEGQASAKLTVALLGTKVHDEARIALLDTGLVAKRPNDEPDIQPAATFRVKWFADFEVLARTQKATGARKVHLVSTHPSMRPQVEAALGPGVEVRYLSYARQLELQERQG